MTPIPKIIYLIWLGDNIPVYVNYIKRIYQEINPDFTVHLITYTIDQIYTIYTTQNFNSIFDSLLYESIQIIFDNQESYKKFLHRILVDEQRIFYGTNLRMIQILSDVYRLLLINTFGGIYIDCDTFPIKPFDSELLNTETFIVCKHIKINSTVHVIRDNYFMGTNGIKKITHNNEEHAYSLLQTTDNWWNNIRFLMLKQKFFKLQLKFGDYSLDKNFYIEHYCDGNWKSKKGKIRTPYCFLDKIHYDLQIEKYKQTKI